jgi:acetyltransferase-like isoleucine patch superfamily enzyme
MPLIEKLIKKVIHLFGKLLRTLNICRLRFAGAKIGRNTMISLRSKIDTRRGKVIIGNNSLITYGCVIVSHDASAKIRKDGKSGKGVVKIGNRVYLGVNSIVLPNVIIGDGSVIGAGSIVTKDIPPGVIAVGNPARVIKRIGDSDN